MSAEFLPAAPTAQARTGAATAGPPPRAIGPPWTLRLRRGHLVALDYALALWCALLAFGFLSSGTGIYEFPFTSWRANYWLPPLLALFLSAPVAARRRSPLIALGLLLTPCAVIMTFGGEITRAAFLPLIFVLYLVAATSRRSTGICALAVILAMLVAQALIWRANGQGSGSVIAAGLVMIIAWMVGYAMRQRRAYVAQLWDQAASTAVAEERLRIARELHDVVAHSMTVVAVQAGFGEYVFDSQPGDARAALGAIQTVSREALSDMQRLLGVLRQPAPLAPAPGLADLDRLVARTAGVGVQVEVEQTGSVRGIPAGIDLSAYRIVQEALTNVVKHSGAASCRVVIGYGASDLSVEITDPGPCARVLSGAHSGRGAAPLTMCAGHGIIGMRERVSLCGGEFSAAALPGQGFKVTARLPLGVGAP